MARNVSSRDPACGYTHDNLTCDQRGDHLCLPRAERVRSFFRELLVHTKGRWARHPFELAPWQWADIIRPLFGRVHWDAEEHRYVRRYRIAWIEVGRKNGKALDVTEPILTAGRGWVQMGSLEPGDLVHAPDGTLTPVLATGPIHSRDSYRVTLSDGRSVVASDEHEWVVVDGHSREHTLTTVQLRDRLTVGTRSDRAWRVSVPAALERKPAGVLPLDPYLLGVWLGDGTSARGEVTTMDAEVVDGIRAAGFRTSYEYRRGLAATYGIPGLARVLRDMGVLNDKHVPDAYLTADEDTRRELLAGLLDTDGGVSRGTNTPRVDFCGTRRLVDDVTFLARSLGLKPGRPSEHNGSWRVTFTATRSDRLFHIARKRDALSEASGRRSKTITVASVESVGVRDVRCIQVEGGMFLAGRDLVPTHNSELMAGIALYLLCADDEEGAEVYGCAKDRDQARKVYDVAERMVILSPTLSKTLKVFRAAKRIVHERTGSFYEVVPADAAGNLGHNPHGIAFDEVLTQPNGDLWEAMKTGMGTRSQPLMVAATTAGNDPASFAKSEHDDMIRVLQDPARSPHIFVYIRNVPYDADPWDESLWELGNPALGTFLKLDMLRSEAQEARENRRKENSFRQFRLNQWVQQTTRFISLDEWDGNCREVALNLDWLTPRLAGQRCWAGLDLSSKLDMTAWSLVFDDGTVLWRFWVPESVVPKLDRHTDSRFGRWVADGWITATDGDVIDYNSIYDAIETDTRRYLIQSCHYDKWCGEPVRQAVEERTNLTMLESGTTFERMTQPMKEMQRALKARELNHAGNPVARWMADGLEAKSPSDDPERIRPVKPDRNKTGKRIDGMVSMLMALQGRLADSAADDIPAADIF